MQLKSLLLHFKDILDFYIVLPVSCFRDAHFIIRWSLLQEHPSVAQACSPRLLRGYLCPKDMLQEFLQWNKRNKSCFTPAFSYHMARNICRDLYYFPSNEKSSEVCLPSFGSKKQFKALVFTRLADNILNSWRSFALLP